MAYSSYNFFTGELDGCSSRDFQKLDYSIKNSEDRIEYLENLLKKSEYFNMFFEDHFKVNLTSGDSLSEEINVCKILENMANYILNSEDVKEEDRKNKPEYVFHKSNERFEKKINRENISINGENGPFNIVDNENIVHSLQVKKQNSKKPKTQTISAKDLRENTKCGEILRDYQIFLDHINKNLKEKPDRMWRYYSQAKSQVQDDMIMVKESLKGIWGLRVHIKESSKPDLDVFDFTDMETVKMMMQMEEPSFEFNLDMRIIWKDFMDVATKANLVEEEKLVLKCMQQQWKIIEISEEFDIKYDRIRRTIIPNIAKKIIKVGCEYDAEDPKIKEKIKNRKEKAKNDNKEKELL